jgi:hypothetical protein
VASWVLVIFLSIAFCPLLLGYNFLPLSHYPGFTRGLLDSSGNPPVFDERFLERYSEQPWLFDADPSWFTLLLPQSFYAATQIQSGRFPLWDPYSGCGAPTLGTGYFRPFDPFKIPFFIAPGLWTYAFSLFLGLLFGAWGAWRLLRSEGLSREACALGAIVFALNPWSMGRIVLQDASATYILPWCILGLRSARWGDWRSLALAAVPLVLMGHVGHPEACIVLAAVAGLDAIANAGSLAALPRKCAALALVALAVALCLAVLWLPPLELFRSGLSYKKVPMVFEYPYAWQALVTPASDLFLLPALAGLFACGLAWGKRRSLWTAAAAASVLLIMPLPGIGHAGAEGLQRLLGVPVFYLKPVFWAGAAFLAARGWDALWEGGIRRTVLAAGVAATACAAGFAFLLWLGPLPPVELAVFPALTLALAAAGVPALLLAGLSPWRGATLTGLVLILAPLGFPLPLNQLAWNRARLGPHQEANWMRLHEPHARAVSIAFRPSFVVPPNWGQALGVRSGEENAVLFPNRYLQLYWKSKFPMTLVIFDSPEFEAFRQLGASLILLPNAQSLPGAVKLFEGSWASAYAVPEASGRLYFATRAAPVDPGKDLSRQILDLGAGSDAVAVVDDPAKAGLPSLPTTPPGAANARFLQDGVHEVTVATHSPAPGFLVLKDTWYRGWRAVVDGGALPIFRVNGCFRGVVVPAGNHEVRFSYSPSSLYTAAAVSLLATLLLAALAVRRPAKSHPPVADGP